MEYQEWAGVSEYGWCVMEQRTVENGRGGARGGIVVEVNY